MRLVRPVRIPVPGLTREIGAGDVVREATHAMGVEPCSPCERRRRALNRRIVFAPWSGAENGRYVRVDDGE